MIRSCLSRTTRAAATAAGIAALLTAAGWMIVSRWPPAERSALLSLLGVGGSQASATRYLGEALADCEAKLAQARATAAARPEDPTSHLRVAGLETHRSSLLALMTYERQRNPQAMDGDTEYPRWRSQYLRQDPDRTLTRAARAAEAALRADGSAAGRRSVPGPAAGSRAGRPLPLQARREAYLLLATAHKELGNPSAEVRALEAAARQEPHRSDLWLRLASAYARARRFSRAEAAMTRALRDE
jgi:predicted Zn-dependent protease